MRPALSRRPLVLSGDSRAFGRSGRRAGPAFAHPARRFGADDADDDVDDEQDDRDLDREDEQHHEKAHGKAEDAEYEFERDETENCEQSDRKDGAEHTGIS